MSDKLRVIILKGKNGWIAQGLERDICAQADTLPALQSRFELTVQLEGELEGGLERIPAAPEHVFALWDSRSGDVSPVPERDANVEYGIAA